jgi:ppGpp synthetase/RelA/SpoT-type nucleotidyltranferase
MAWIKPKYSHGTTDRAEKTLLVAVLWEDQRTEMLDVINNWRSAHGYPLHAITNALKLRAKKVDEDCIVARRLKRLSSIKRKLSLQPNMKLTQMQDVGGCRAIMSGIHQLKELVNAYEGSWLKNPHGGRPQLSERYDYISTPKGDGYRGIHFVYKYQTNAAGLKEFSGRRIEIQIRTRLQHSWATAVETIETFTRSALRSNLGNSQWKRFFVLMSSALAIKEGCARVPGTPVEYADLIKELSLLTNQLEVERIFLSLGFAAYQVGKRLLEDDTEFRHEGLRNADMFLLVLNPADKNLQVFPYQSKQLKEATAAYLKIESEQTELQAVLVSVDRIEQLRNAYPNYYLDTEAFLDDLREFTGKNIGEQVVDQNK